MKFDKNFNKKIKSLHEQRHFGVMFSWIPKVMLSVGSIILFLSIWKLWNGLSLLWIFFFIVSVLCLWGGAVIYIHVIEYMSKVTDEFMARVNSKCLIPYEKSYFLQKSGKWSFRKVSLSLWAEMMIDESYATVQDRRLKNFDSENDLQWHVETDQLLEEVLGYLPYAAIRIRSRVKRAIGNTNMTLYDKKMLMLQVLTYFNVEATNKRPSPSKAKSAAISKEASVDKIYQKTKPEKRKNTIGSLKIQTNHINPEVSKEPNADIFITLKEERHRLLPIGKVSEYLPSELDEKIVWAILVNLLEFGKGISMAGGYKRKSVYIKNDVLRTFSEEGWKQNFQERNFDRAIVWLEREKIIEKRSHDYDYGLNFKIGAKGTAGTQISKLLNAAKSHRVKS